MDHDKSRTDDETSMAPDRVDGILALILIALCVFFYILTSDFPVPGAFLGDNVLPEQFPRLLLITIGIMALALPFEHILETERWPLIKKSRSAPIGFSTFATIGFLLALVAVAEFIGTVLTIFVAVVGLPLVWGERRLVLVIVYALAFTALVTYVFSTVLRVYFEPGLLNLAVR